MIDKRLIPQQYVESVQDIDYEALKKQGVKGLIFDIDNTLVPHGADSTAEVDKFCEGLKKKGFRLLLLSNNNEARILRFKKNIECQYICEANKPLPGNYLRAADMMGVTKEEVVVIGDQIFTDIKGANDAGMRNILVKYIGHEKREWKGFRRYLEWMLLKLFFHNQ